MSTIVIDKAAHQRENVLLDSVLVVYVSISSIHITFVLKNNKKQFGSI